MCAGCQISIKNFVRSSEGQLYCRTHFPLRQTAFTAGKGVSVGKETLGGFKSVEMKGKKGGKLMPSSDSGATISAPTPATTTTTKSSTALVVYLPPTDQHPVTALDKVITGSDYSLASALATDDADLLFAVGFLYYSQGGFSEAVHLATSISLLSFLSRSYPSYLTPTSPISGTTLQEVARDQADQARQSAS